MQLETEEFNRTWGQTGPDDPTLEWAVAATQEAQKLYNKFFERLSTKVPLLASNSQLG